MVSHILSAVFVVVFGLDHAVSKECGFSRNVDIGERFTIESPNYPNPTSGGIFCKWDLSSPKNSIISLNCPDFDIPGCDSLCIDTFYFAPSGDWNDAEISYCGKRILELNTTGNLLSAVLGSEPDNMVSPEFISRHSHRKFRCDVSVIEVKTDTPDCGKNNLRSRIVGGEESQLHEWPWQVYMRANISSFSYKFCGGSLISKKWVLTAAHCVDGFTEDKISLRIGEHDINMNETNHTVESTVSQIIIHQDWVMKWPYYYDIALLRLTDPVEYSHGISPVCLPYNLRDQTFEYEQVTATGWGRTSWSTGGSSDKLLEVDLKVLPNSVCTGTDYPNYPWQFDQVCVAGGKDGESTYSGDSGGPLVWLDTNGQYQQIGISSFIIKKHAPSGYTRITSYIDWIKENSNIQFCSKG